MLRPFLTRLPNSLSGVVLLVPCLLICLACTTPFAFKQLEKGLTQGEVRALVGEPKSTWVPDIAGKPAKPGVVEEAWAYRYWLVNEIALYFEDAKLIRWKVYGNSSGGGTSGGGTWNSFNSTFLSRDAAHHARGHKHHHGHK